MPSTRWNKVVAPSNNDNFTNLTTDMQTQADKSNVIVPVASAAERDGLAPPGGKYAGLAVARTDVTGEPIEVYNGTGFDRQVSSVVQAASQFVGSGMAANDFTTGTKRPFWQGGTYIGTTDGAGNIAITYPVAFPNGIITAVAMSGDSTAGGNGLVLQLAGPFTQTLTTLYLNASTSAGAKINTTLRFNWMALGW